LAARPKEVFQGYEPQRAGNDMASDRPFMRRADALVSLPACIFLRMRARNPLGLDFLTNAAMKPRRR
jgi:hypothetical protein